MNYQLVIDRFEGDWAILVFDDKTELKLQKNKLPEKVKEGDTLDLNIKMEHEARDEKEKKAKDVLNELLNSK